MAGGLGLSPQESGAALEGLVAARLSSEGYSVERNVIVQGRSGGKHELDVVATRSDGLTTFTIVVECKSWMQQVDKGVIAKAKYVSDDVGGDKTVVVAPGGFGPGAVTAAVELGVELWGPDEARRNLSAFAHRGPPGEERDDFLGVPFGMETADAEAWLEKRAEKGFRKKTITHQFRIYVPCVQISGSFVPGGLFGRKGTETRWWSFELLGGNLIDASRDGLPLAPTKPFPSLPHWTDVRDVTTLLTGSLSILCERDVPASNRAKLSNPLAVPGTLESYSLGAVRSFYLGCYVGLLRQRSTHEVAVLGGLDGKRWPMMEELLTHEFGRFRAELAGLNLISSAEL